MAYTIIYRRYSDTHVTQAIMRDFDMLEEACKAGDKEFASKENFDCFLRLPSGRVMAFTRMFGLV